MKHTVARTRPSWPNTAVFAWLVISAVGACSQTPVVLPSRDLDRPTDMTFACVSTIKTGDGQVVITGQPMGKCHPYGAPDPAPPRPGIAISDSITYRTYSFVPNADRGDLSVIDMSYCRPNDTACQPPGASLVDLDPTSEGFGAVPLGTLPEAIAASQDGCRVVTANRGSCDLTLVDPSVLLTKHLDPTHEVAMPPAVRDAVTVVPLMASGRLQVAPSEIAFVPQQTAVLASLDDNAAICDPMAAGTLAPPVGDPIPGAGERVPWRAVATFPSCDLVALIELPSGVILDSYQVVGGSQPLFHSGTNPVCPSTDCPFVPATAPDGGVAGTGGAGGDAASVADAGAAPAPTTTRVGALGISALAVHPEGNRIYFGGTNTPSIFVLDIAGQAFVAPASATSNVMAMSEGAGGAVRMRLSVDPFDYSKGHDAFTQSQDPKDAARPEYGRFVAGRHDNQPDDPLEFLYVIAKDGSLRVLDVAQTQPVECDLNIDPTDPLALATPPDPDDTSRKACFVYKAPKGPRRLPSAGIPGRRFAGAPQDIAFANYRSPPTSTPATPSVDEEQMSGAFAFVMTNAGAVYIVNIDPELRVTNQVVRDANGELHYNTTDPQTKVAESPRPLTHSSRDFNVITYSTSLGTQIGPPRVDALPSIIADGPQLMKFMVSESRVDARVIPSVSVSPPSIASYVYFPNRATVHPQTWHIQWEGDISSVRISGDIVDSDPGTALSAPLVTTITDNGSGFCPLGGGDGDIMTLVGCDTDSACPIGMICVHSKQVPPTVDSRAIQGMCLARTMTDYEVCEPMLQTFRRYEIVSAPNGATTTVVPLRAEVARPAYTNAQMVRATCDPNNVNTTTGKNLDCTSDTNPADNGFECVAVTVRPDGTPLRDRTVSKTSDGATVINEAEPRLRCLQPCGGKGNLACRQGRVCVAYPDGSYCAEGAPIVRGCGLDQLFSYKLSAGRSFLVTGSVSGRTEAFKPTPTDQGPICVRDPSVPNMVARIPMNSPVCDADSTPAVTVDATKGTRTWNDDFLGKVTGPNYPASDPCFVFDQPAAVGNPSTLPPPVVSAVFQNAELRFVLTDLQKQFRDTALIQFTVNGGISPQMVPASSDAIPGLPARIMVGPVPSLPYATACGTTPCPDTGHFSDLSYLFVVDQRGYSSGRLGPRGQILRIIPRISATVPYAGFESFASSGSYFPIQ